MDANDRPDADADASLEQSRIGRLFDVRLVIGGVMTIYGVILIIKGLFDNDAAIRKAANTHVNLWTGIGLLVLGLVFLLWMRLNPIEITHSDDTPSASGDQGGGRRAEL